MLRLNIDIFKLHVFTSQHSVAVVLGFFNVMNKLYRVPLLILFQFWAK